MTNSFQRKKKIDSYINHDEFFSKKEQNSLKEEIKNPKNAVEYAI